MDVRWLAGFVDGEGCIGITVCRYKGAKGQELQGFTPQISIYNTDKAVLQLIKASYSGYLHPTSFDPKTQKPCYCLKLTGSNARNLIESLLPYLRLSRKRKVAELVLNFPLRRKGRAESNKAIYKKQLAILKRIHRLNKRGIKKNVVGNGERQ